MPGGGQWAGLGFAVADDAGDDQVRIVERGPKAWLIEYPSSPPSWIDPGVCGETWLEIPPGKENCLNSFFSPASSWLMFGIDLAVRAFEVDVAHHRRGAVAGTGDVDHVEVMLLDDPVQMRVDEVLARRRAPVSQQQLLHVLQLQRLPSKGLSQR